MSQARPLAFLDVDGVFALEDPQVPVLELDAIRDLAAGRPWAWLDDGIDDLGLVPDPRDGVLVRLDGHRGITDVNPELLLADVSALVSSPRPFPGS